MPKVFGWQHITYLVVSIVITIATLILGKIYCKTEKQQTVFIKIIARLILATVLGCRFAVASTKGWQFFLPNTICGITSFVLSLCVIFGKPNMKIYHGLWFLAMVGGLATIIYPDFIGQAQSIFYPATIFVFLHHSLCILICCAMLMFGWFKFDYKKSYVFTILFCFYIVWGLFDIQIIGADTAMCITRPLLDGTPLNCWFILGVGTVLIFVFTFAYNFIESKLKAKKVEQNQVADKGEQNS